MTVAAPQSGREIQAAIIALHEESVRYWSSFDTRAFLAPIGDAWSPADNVRHLTKSMRAVTQGLRIPRLILLAAFFAPTRPSRTYEEVREVYRARLAKGASAGRFGPSVRSSTEDTDAARAQIMEYHAVAVRSLVAAIARWPESLLDRRHLPHPLLGKLTVREMLLFTLYHNQHHVDNVKRRLAAATPRAADA